MIDYLINIVFAASTYWGVSLALYAVYLFLPWAKFDEAVAARKDWAKNASIAMFVLGTLVGVTSPSNTYKNTVDYNKTQDLNRIEQLNEARASRPLEIIDISRQPQTAEERAASAIDMRERVNLDNQ
jgi:hypothetical protein